METGRRYCSSEFKNILGNVRSRQQLEIVYRREPFTRGMKAFGVFLFFGATMAAFAGTTLLWRGTIADRVWQLNPTAYEQLAPLGTIVGVPFLVLSAALLAAGIGWFGRRLWAWRLAVAIIAIQVIGDLFNALRGELLKGATGVVIASALLFYLLRPAVRAAFNHDKSSSALTPPSVNLP